MKKLIFILFPFLLLYACQDENPENKSDNPNETETPQITEPSDTIFSLYDIESLPEITLKISVEEWNKLLSYYDQNAHNEEYIKGNFTFKKDKTTDTLSGVGIRLRGNSSRRRPEGATNEIHNATNTKWHHASFTVNFKKYNKSQLFHKSEKLILKWFKDDPTYVREVYCYDLFERFGVWTAPQSSYCKLTIHIEGDKDPAYFGVYQMIEPVDEVFLGNRKKDFTDDSGFLWKANYGASLKYANRVDMDVENVTLSETYTPIYDLKTKKKNIESARDQLSDFINSLNSKNGTELKTWLTNSMDVDLFLRTYAVNVICGMWDDYWVNSNNFYFYFNSDGKFFFIPYDYDNTLGTSYIIANSGTQDLLNWGNGNDHPLVKKVLSIPEYKTKYIAYLHELCDAQNDYFYDKKSIARITKWQNMIRKHISNDTGEDMQLADQPAYWGNCSYYRLLSSQNNFFTIRSANLPTKQK